MKTIQREDLMELLGEFKSVEKMPARNGNDFVFNQFILTYENGEVFQSYKSLVGAKTGGRLYLTRFHDYGDSTSKCCSGWCGLAPEERRRGIKDETIIMVQLFASILSLKVEETERCWHFFLIFIENTP